MHEYVVNAMVAAIVVFGSPWAAAGERFAEPACTVSVETPERVTTGRCDTWYVDTTFVTLADLGPVVCSACRVRSSRVILALDQTGSMCHYRGFDHNDVENRRILASHLFLDSLAARDAAAELGILRFVGNDRLDPLPLGDPASRLSLHHEIERARCSGGPSFPEFLSKAAAPRRASLPHTSAATYTGSALQVALVMADLGYDTIAHSHERAIVVLTDGGWHDAETLGPDVLVNDYRSTHLDRPIPAVHGIVISDSAWHVDSGYPAFMDSEELGAMTELTGGTFYPRVQPPTVVPAIMAVLDTILTRARALPDSVWVHNLVTGQSAPGAIQGRDSLSGGVVVEFPALPLALGPNEIRISFTFGRGREVRDTLTVVRYEPDGTVGVRGYGRSVARPQAWRVWFDAAGRRVAAPAGARVRFGDNGAAIVDPAHERRGR